MSLKAQHEFEETGWTVYWQAPIAFSAGSPNPDPPRSGLVLKSDKGERLFLPMRDEMQPTDNDLRNIDKFIGWLAEARANG